MSLSRVQVLRATTTSPWTKDFRHMLPIPRHWMKRKTIQDPYIKAVAPKQRIKYWNIVPGDQIRVQGESEGTIHEVLSINRISNRVFLKGIVTDNQQPEGKPPASKNVHYSRCQLFIGNYEFPPVNGSTQPVTKAVFAQRLGRTKPYWQPMGHRWQWERVVAKTTPSLPEGTEKERIVVPWPRPEKRTLPEASMYDTLQDAVLEVTYKVPAFPVSATDPIPRPPKETIYVNSLFNPAPVLVDGPVEVHLYRELSNPHSRAKKQARWQAHQRRVAAKLKAFIEEELKELKGRSVREARAEATWKWRQSMAEERRVEKKRRWKSKGSETKMIRKKARKERKERKKRQRLTEMILQDAPNQVITTTTSPLSSSSS